MAAETARLSLDTIDNDVLDVGVVCNTEPSPEVRKRNALAVIGMANSGLGDLSANHDDYLTETYAG